MRRPDQSLSPWAQGALAYLSALHGVGSRARWTLVLLNYQFALDDAGKPNLKFCGAGGYLATGEHWAAYLRAWSALPEEIRADKFRFSEFVREVGAGRRRAEEIQPLVDILRAHMQVGLSRYVHMESWNALPAKYRRLWKHPYCLCTMLLLDDVLTELQRFSDMDPAERLVTMAEYMDPYDPSRPPSPADYARRQLERRTAQLWDFWVELRGMRERVRPIVFDDKRHAPQLQAADLYAHASYRVLSRPHWPLRFAGLAPVSNSPPFPQSLYAIMQPFMTGPKPLHYEGHVMDADLARSFPAFDELIRRMEEGPPDPNDPLEALLRKMDEGS